MTPAFTAIGFLEGTARAALGLYLETAPFLLVGCLLGGLIHAFFPGRAIERWLGGRGARGILIGALAGAPLPLCSCGVVPTAITLRRRGASVGATVAFVIATPETGPDSLLVSFALLDPLFALFRPLAALVTAVTAGALAQWAGVPRALPVATPLRLCEICALPDEGEHHHSLAARLRRATSFAAKDLIEDIGPWLLIGLLLAGALSAAMPPDFVARHLDSRLLQMLLALGVGIPLYVCASASTPLAAAAVAAGFSPGAALVLMLAGPATNAASLLVLRREFGTRVVALMLAGVAGASLALGFALDAVYGWFGIAPHVRVVAPESFDAVLGVVSGVVLALLIVAVFVRKLAGRGRASECSTCSHDVGVAAHPSDPVGTALPPPAAYDDSPRRDDAGPR